MISDIIRNEEFRLGAEGHELTVFQSKVQSIINQKYSLKNCPNDNCERIKRAFLKYYLKR